MRCCADCEHWLKASGRGRWVNCLRQECCPLCRNAIVPEPRFEVIKVFPESKAWLVRELPLTVACARAEARPAEPEEFQALFGFLRKLKRLLRQEKLRARAK